MEKYEKSASKIQSQIKDLQEKILEIGGVRLRSQQAKVDGIHDQLLSLNTSVTNIQVERAAKERSLQKIIKSFEKSVNELESVSNELENLIVTNIEQRKESASIKDRVQTAKNVCLRLYS